MSRVVVITSDTNHHRFFLNQMRAAGVLIDIVLFETDTVQAPFRTGPLYEEEQEIFECTRWSGNLALVGFDVFRCANVNQVTEHVATLEPEIGVVFGSRRLSPQFISLFPSGLINVHRGITGEYRGLDSELWAAYHGDWGNIGVTLHMINEELDTGDIVFQQRLELANGMRLPHLRAHTTEIATVGMISVLNELMAGRLVRKKQEAIGRYYSFMPLEIKRLVWRKFDRYCERLPK